MEHFESDEEVVVNPEFLNAVLDGLQAENSVILELCRPLVGIEASLEFAQLREQYLTLWDEIDETLNKDADRFLTLGLEILECSKKIQTEARRLLASIN